jgi:membrane protein implicated in regulation of membrane protease activity
MTFLNDLQDWHWWAAGGILLIILEMFTGSFYLACFGVASLITSIAASGDVAFTAQLGTFALISALTLGLVRPIFKKLIYKHCEHKPVNADGMLGATALVVDEIPGRHLPGRVKYQGEEWRALNTSEERIPEGRIVQILQVQGATVTVRNISE